MQNITSATELLNSGQTALVIFTKGKGLTENHNGTGSSGWWYIDTTRKVDLVIIYRRGKRGPTDNEVFSGKHDGVDGPFIRPGLKKPRYVVNLRDFKLVAQTTANWRIFAQAHQGPIRYLSKASG
jgi:hypothetical protein